VRSRQAATAVDAPTASVSAADGAQSSPPKLVLDPTNDPNAQGRKKAFVGNLDPRGDVNPHVLTPPPSPYTLSAGSVISASLITGLRSDLPGWSPRRLPRTLMTAPRGGSCSFRKARG